MDDLKAMPNEAQRFVWGGAIPLQIHLHDSEVTTVPPPPPALILAPRIGYLPLLVPQIKPFFSGALPPGVDTVWFDYRGLPLKWYIPTGVLFDLLCAEPERPWNLTVHFRGYPTNLLIPCVGEDSVKWNFINALKEAAYIINGNCKNIMNMSQSDQVELWLAVLNGQLDVYFRISSKLKLEIVGDDFSHKLNSSSPKSSQSFNDSSAALPTRTGKIPVRLYLRTIEDVDDLEDAHIVDSWDNISYINRPVECFEEGKHFTLYDALKALLPDLLADKSSIIDHQCETELVTEEEAHEDTTAQESNGQGKPPSNGGEIKLVRIQGIEPKLEIPFSWVANNLMHPDHYLHICLFLNLKKRDSVEEVYRVD